MSGHLGDVGPSTVDRSRADRAAAEAGLEAVIARLLTVGSYASIAMLVVGTALLLVEGHSPLESGPPFDLRAIPGDLLAVRSSGFLWLGIVGLLATPSSRVLAALVGYLRTADRRMAVIAALILVVLVIGVIAGLAAE